MSDLVRDALSGKDLPPDLKKLQLEVLGQLANLKVADVKREGWFRGAMMTVYVAVFAIGGVGSILLFIAGALGIIKLDDAYRNSVIVGSGGAVLTSGIKLVVSWVKPADKL